MKQNILRITTGAIITLIGIAALLGALNVIPFWDIFGQWWPALVVIGGLFSIISDPRQNYIWGIALITAGVLLTLKNLSVIDFNVFSLVLPIIIIATGLSVTLSVSKVTRANVSSKDSDNITAIFSGSDSVNKSKSYKGGQLNAAFGGIELDLREAKLEDGAQLELFVLCGGIELKVPKDWRVVSKATVALGGIENKSRGDDNDKNPTLILSGLVALGGVEIKH